MAGAGYKLFNTGDVLTAAQVNTYLQEQVVMVFANSTARTTALSGVLAEGMVSYLKDTDALEIYSGSAWVGYGSGDITGVTAGTGISGGGTSGTVTITNSMATEITAAGDIIVGTGSGTFDNLPIGTTGQVLTADTTVSPYKVKWAAAGGGGALVLTGSADFTTSSSVVISNCFSSTYDYYVCYVNYSALSAGSVLQVKMRLGGTSAASNYTYNLLYGTSSTAAAAETASTSQWGTIESGSSYATRTAGTLEFFNPGTAVPTKMYCKGRVVQNSGSTYVWQVAGDHNTSTAYDSLELISSSGTMSGSARVYGYAKS